MGTARSPNRRGTGWADSQTGTRVPAEYFTSDNEEGGWKKVVRKKRRHYALKGSINRDEMAGSQAPTKGDGGEPNEKKHNEDIIQLGSEWGEWSESASTILKRPPPNSCKQTRKRPPWDQGRPVPGRGHKQGVGR